MPSRRESRRRRRSSGTGAAAAGTAGGSATTGTAVAGRPRSRTLAGAAAAPAVGTQPAAASTTGELANVPGAAPASGHTHLDPLAALSGHARVPASAGTGSPSPRFVGIDPLSTPMSLARRESGSRSATGTPSILKGYGRSPSITGTGTSTPRPPILSIPPLPPPMDQPEFAELLTPAQMRRRRRPARVDVPTGMDTLGSVGGLPVMAGPSRLGYTTGDGDLYRGAASDPTVTAAAADGPEPGAGVEEDAVTLSSGSSGSSSWSWGSGLEHGRRATMAVVHRVGEAIGMRRGSTSSSNDSGNRGSSTSSSSSDSSSGNNVSRIGRFGRALSRTMSRATNESSPERPRRVYVPRRREFRLYTPPPDEERQRSAPPSASFTSLSSLPLVPGPPLPVNAHAFPTSDRLEGTIDPRTSDRVVITPVLPPVLEAVRAARVAAGVMVVPPPEVASARRHGPPHHHHAAGNGKSKLSGGSNIPVRRGGSAPGKKREFTLPTVPPRPVLPRAQSRVEALRSTASIPVRPKSASDLLGLSMSSSSITSEDTDSIPTQPTITPSGSPPLPPTPAPSLRHRPRAAWWLDVSCPTWKDLRDIGELLNLHPLTLEDVLHQDPREKLDMYDKLGYYFIVVRALDEQYFKYTPGSTRAPGAELAAASAGLTGTAPSGTATVTVTPPDPETHHAKRKERTRRGWGFGRATGKAATKLGEKVEIVEDNPGKEGLEGVTVGGVNLYLVVFADGIVSFHYDDVSKHERRVLERVLASTGDEATSDWISHGLLDSVVDAFFPLMGYVDGAVDDIDSLTIDPQCDPRAAAPQAEHPSPVSPSDTPYNSDERVGLDDKNDMGIEMEDLSKRRDQGVTGLHLRQRGAKARRAIKKRKASFSQNLRKEHASGAAHALSQPKVLMTQWMVIFVYLKLFLLPVTSARERPHERISGDKDVFDRSTMLKSITDMRRLVTGLSRLLVGKHSVVTSLLKRARESAIDSDDEAYLSDVADHILLLQTSLYHYEYILAQCQLGYLSYLNVSSSSSRGGTDHMILALSTVTIGILPMQVITGVFSMNVNAPRNGDRENHLGADGNPAGFGYFGGVVVAISVIGFGFVLIIRWWRWVARKKWTTMRGGELPSVWDGFWGWA